MCGIAGYVTRGADPPDAPALQEMADVLSHRGPDSSGLHTESIPDANIHLGLAHRRLAVIDIEGGRQPMGTADRRFWIVYNGEVYNFEEIRAELEGEGARFRTRSDTEVVLQLYRRRGTAMLDRLTGMFAFAIWDARERTLFLARDRLGQKPLVYFHGGRRFAFGSEIKALFRLPWVPREPALEMLPAYLAHLYVPSPHTFFRGIAKLPPGHFLLWSHGRIRVQRYWERGSTGEMNLPRWAAADRVRNAIQEATQSQLVSDVPLGSFLSGGIDSSIVTSSMAEASDRPVKTFSIGFDRPEYDESRYARMVAGRLGTEHREFRVTAEAMALLPRMVWFFDEPFGDSSAIPTYSLAKMTRQHVTVALSGDGGDETFGGYDRYRALLISLAADRFMPRVALRALAHLWRGRPSRWPRAIGGDRAARLIEVLDQSPTDRYLRWLSTFTPEQIRRLIEPSAVPEGQPPATLPLQNRIDGTVGDLVQNVMDADLQTYLPEDLLVKVDVATMANSLECRSPFLDHRLVELAAALPRPWKVGPLRSKGILREAFADRLPPRILRRRKMGFGVPIGQWFREGSGDALSDILIGPEAASRGIFRQAEVRRLLEEHRSGAASHAHRLWALLFFEVWMRQQIDSRPTLTPPPEDAGAFF